MDRYYANHEKILESRKEKRDNMTLEEKEKRKEYHKEYYQKNKEKYSELQKKYREENKEKINLHRKEKIANNPLERFKKRVRGTLRKSFLRQRFSKNGYTQDIIGCTFEELKVHLETTWFNNYGTVYNNEPVHIDHIVPLDSAKSEEEVIKLCHWSNL